MAEQDLVSKYRKTNVNSKIGDEEWDCDIYSILCELIHEYNETLSYDPGPAFRNAQKTKQRLKDLLKQDFEHLIYYNPYLAVLKDNVYFEEALRELPGASAMNSNNFKEFLILVNTPLLNFIHSFNVNFDVVTQSNKLDGYLEKYDEIALSDALSDTAIMGNVMLDVKNFYADHKLHSVASLDYYREPYNVCERVKATRKFIIAHELAHILLDHHKEELSKRRLIKDHPEFDFFLFKKEQEYDADAFAFDMVLKEFDKEHLSDIEYYELINVINGIRIYFVMLEFVESFHEWHKITSDYPHSNLREMAIFDRAFMWISSRARQALELLEGLTSIKNQFRNLPFKAPSMKYGVAIMEAMYHAETMTDDEIRDQSNDSDLAQFLIKYRGYASVFEKYKVYNSQIFNTITEDELGIFYHYYAVQFSPEYGRDKIANQFKRIALKKLEDHPEGQSEAALFKNATGLLTEGDYMTEATMMTAQLLLGPSVENFEQRYKDCWENSLEKLKEFREQNAN